MSEQDGPSTPSEIRTYRRALEDARDTLGELYQSISILEQKGWRVVRINLIITTIVLSALTTSGALVSIRLIPLTLLFLSTLFLSVSTGWGFAMQKRRSAELGVGSEMLNIAAEGSHHEHDYLSRALDMYLESIKTAKQRNGRMATYLDAAIYTSIVGVTLMLSTLILVYII
ncbi:hypothetical protein [Halorubrum trapanicum]|uniref:hypothetical protein n=1 Tax=Halorubrum trapanicum TaxID=29284 RepID=UPI0012FE5C96|nr:hypothetical protein [Halorubrum trapanicum]